MLIGVLALQGDVSAHRQAFESLGVASLAVRRRVELAQVDGIVIPGGESTTISRLLDHYDLFDPLADRINAGLPAFGTCAGMILLAEHVLDGVAFQRQIGSLDIKVRRNAYGRQVHSFERDLAFSGLTDGPFRGVFIRAPSVESVGPDVEVLASLPLVEETDSDAGRIVAVRQGQVLATSFHPELTGDNRVHRLFADMIRAGSGSQQP